MKSKAEIEKQLDDAHDELKRIEREEPIGCGSWRRQKGYIDALEWVLDKEGEAK